MKRVPPVDSQNVSHRSLRPQATSLTRAHTQCPRLLVSVRSLDEARRAIAGGAEILDVKEPSRGSLGMAAIDDIVQIAAVDSIANGAIPCSVALGEVADWSQSTNIPVLPTGISFVKLGLYRCASNAEWRVDWRNVRERFARQSLSRLRWVAVAYADAQSAQSPPIADVLEEAIESGCEGLLIDTWGKRNQTLLDMIDTATLTRLADDCHVAGLFFALAGKLRTASLTLLARVPADVIAIRSAACIRSERTSEVDVTRIAEFGAELRRCFDR